MTTKRNKKRMRRKKGGVYKTALQKAEEEAEDSQKILNRTRKRLEHYQKKLAKEKKTIYDDEIKKIIDKKLSLDQTIIELGKASQREVKRNKKLQELISGPHLANSYVHPPFDRKAYETAYRPSYLGRFPSPEPKNSNDRRPLELLDFVPARLGLF